MTDLHVRPDTRKLLEENVGRTLLHKLQQWFLDLSPRVKKIRAKKIFKKDLIKFKSFRTAKEIINKTKRQPTEWEKIAANNDWQGVNTQHI